MRRNEPGNFLWRSGIREVKNANTRVKPGDRNDGGIGSAWREPALRVVRAEAPARKTEVRVRRVGRRRRARKEADYFWISRIFHIKNIRSVVDLAAIGLQRFVDRNQHI